MAAAVGIQTAKIGDAAAIAHLHRTARAEAMPWLPVLHSLQDDLRYFRDVVLHNEQVWVASNAAAVLGFAATANGWLNHLYVSPEQWRGGLGRTLLEAAQTHVPSGLQLWTFQHNQMARRFYATHGFREVEFTNGQDNEERCPDVRMMWP